jgi:hypothetical protein
MVSVLYIAHFFQVPKSGQVDRQLLARAAAILLKTDQEVEAEQEAQREQDLDDGPDPEDELHSQRRGSGLSAGRRLHILLLRRLHRLLHRLLLRRLKDVIVIVVFDGCTPRIS